MDRRAKDRSQNVLNNSSFLDVMSNTVGALAFLLLLVVLVTVTLKLNYFDLEIKTENLPDAFVGEPYNVVLAGVGGNEPYTWSQAEGEFPEGLEFIVVSETVLDQYNQQHTTISGKLHGVPQKVTKEPIKLTFTLDDTPVVVDEKTGERIDKTPTTKTFNLNVIERPEPFIPEPLKIQTDKLPTAIVNAPYVIALSATGGFFPYRWEKEGDLPQGPILDVKGRISGTPSKKGKGSIVLKVTDAKGTVVTSRPISWQAIVHKDEKDILDGVIKKLAVTTFKIPDAVEGDEYDLTLAAKGGIPPYQWSVMPSELPPGLEFDNTNGRVHGIPKKAVEKALFTVKVSYADSFSGKKGEAKKEFAIVVKSPPFKADPLTLF